MTARAWTPNETALHLVIKDVYSEHEPALHVMTPANRAKVVKALSEAGFTQQPVAEPQMKAYIVVYVNSAKSYLCKSYGDHYEVEAEGESSALQRLATQLNGVAK